ncbi:MAG TPA: hypothetical protein VNJ08_13500 [Bacteriovoracaceae bacterium]|nr:hypothetical protein [Bacteriovoracaceae bacterium]
MKTLRVNPAAIFSTVHVPGSKSYANRVLILAALNPGAFTIHDLPDSSDVTLLADALKSIGLQLTSQGRSLTILNSFPACESSGKTVEVGEGGTTARFLASMLLLGKQPYNLVLGSRLKERPWQEFIEFVKAHGGHAELNDAKLSLQGPLSLPAKIEIDCSRTTQFASGICMAFANQGIEVAPVNMTSSQSYWDMTQELIKIPVSWNSFHIPLDWSSASYPLAFAALNHPVFFPGLYPDKYQSDSKFHDLLKSFEALESRKDGIQVTPIRNHKAVVMDASDCLDLVPALAFFLSHIKGTHELTGIGNLVFKESDRLSEIRKLLEVFNRQTGVRGGSLYIEGHTSKLSHEINLTLPDDHRMVMAGTLFLRHHMGGLIGPSEAVNKSYPGYFNLFPDCI